MPRRITAGLLNRYTASFNLLQEQTLSPASPVAEDNKEEEDDSYNHPFPTHTSPSLVEGQRRVSNYLPGTHPFPACAFISLPVVGGRPTRNTRRSRGSYARVVYHSEEVSEVSQDASVLFNVEDKDDDNQSDSIDLGNTITARRPFREYQDSLHTRLSFLDRMNSGVESVSDGENDDNMDDSGSEGETHPNPPPPHHALWRGISNTTSSPPTTQAPRIFTQEEVKRMATPPIIVTEEEQKFLKNSVDDGSPSNLEEPNDRLLLQLYRLCRRPRFPRYLFDELIGILKLSKAEGANMDDEYILSFTADSFYTKVILPKSYLLPPQTTYIPIESARPQEDISIHRLPRASTAGTTFDVCQAYYSILDGVDTSDASNLVVNQKDLWNQSNFDPMTMPGEIIPAADVQKYIRDHQLVPLLDLCAPVILYQGEIGITQNQRMGVNPVLMACGLIRHDIRYLKRNVCIVGFVPRFDKGSKAQKAAKSSPKEGKGRLVRNYHACLDVILAGFRVLEETNKKPRYFQIKNEINLVRLHAPIVLFVGGAKALDIMAARWGSYYLSKRISRFCDASSKNAGIPGHVCNVVPVEAVWPSVETIMNNPDATEESKKEAKSNLIALCTHHCWNCMWNTNLCNKDYIPLPHDMMHIFSTLMRTIFQILVSPMSNGERANLDIAAAQIFGSLKSGEATLFPRTFFSHGLTSISMLSAKEWVGTMLLSLILLNTRRGSKLMQECVSRSRARTNARSAADCAAKVVRTTSSVNTTTTSNNKTKVDQNGDIIELLPLVEVTVDEIVEVLEELLMFHAFAYNGYNPLLGEASLTPDSILKWTADRKPILRERIARIQTLIVNRLPRHAGAGWCTQKFHEMLHIPRNITKFGFPYQFDTGWGENLLKDFGKAPTKTVRKQYDNKFIGSVADRIYKSWVISYIAARSSVDGQEEEKKHVASTPVGVKDLLCGDQWWVPQSHPQWNLLSDGEGTLVECKWRGKLANNAAMEMPQLVVERLIDELLYVIRS